MFKSYSCVTKWNKFLDDVLYKILWSVADLKSLQDMPQGICVICRCSDEIPNHLFVYYILFARKKKDIFLLARNEFYFLSETPGVYERKDLVGDNFSFIIFLFPKAY